GVLVAALASLALCQETRVYRDGSNWVQEMTGDLGAAKNLRVKLAAGSVQVQGGSQTGITYVIHRKAYTSSEQQARREFESYRINTSVKGETVWVVAESSRRDSKCADEFVINVPRNLESAKIETGGGNVKATGIAGRVDLESGGGNIHLDDIGGEVTVETGGGNIKIASAKGQIKAESGGGSVVVLSGLQGAVLETGAGSIRVDKCSGTVKATTGGGSVDLGEIGGPAQIETGGGSIQLDGATSVQAETSAGGIIVKLLSSAGASGRNNSTLETSAGDITVYLASDLAISIRAEIEIANGHTIRSDFSDIRVSTEGGSWGPKTVTAEGQLNGGGPVLKVRTNSGNVNFRRVSR